MMTIRINITQDGLTDGHYTLAIPAHKNWMVYFLTHSR